MTPWTGTPGDLPLHNFFFNCLDLMELETEWVESHTLPFISFRYFSCYTMNRYRKYNLVNVWGWILYIYFFTTGHLRCHGFKKEIKRPKQIPLIKNFELSNSDNHFCLTTKIKVGFWKFTTPEPKRGPEGQKMSLDQQKQSHYR